MDDAEKNESPVEDEARRQVAEERFTRDLEERGEAAEPDPEGNLPPGATHEVTVAENGERQIRRRRFSVS
jgi:hypothetical protein